MSLSASRGSQKSPSFCCRFPRWCFRELLELRGDRGAQTLLQRHLDRLVRIPMPSAELDIDRPEDLLTLEVATQVKRQQLGDS